MTDNNIVDVSVVANFLMLSDRRVQQLAKSGYIPKAARGKYDLKAAIQGYIGFLKAQIEEGDLDGEDGDLGDAQTIKTDYSKPEPQGRNGTSRTKRRSC